MNFQNVSRPPLPCKETNDCCMFKKDVNLDNGMFFEFVELLCLYTS